LYLLQQRSPSDPVTTHCRTVSLHTQLVTVNEEMTPNCQVRPSTRSPFWWLRMTLFISFY